MAHLDIGGGDAAGDSTSSLPPLPSSPSFDTSVGLDDILAILEKNSFCLRERMVGSKLPLRPVCFPLVTPLANSGNPGANSKILRIN